MGAEQVFLRCVCGCSEVGLVVTVVVENLSLYKSNWLMACMLSPLSIYFFIDKPVNQLLFHPNLSCD